MPYPHEASRARLRSRRSSRATAPSSTRSIRNRPSHPRYALEQVRAFGSIVAFDLEAARRTCES